MRELFLAKRAVRGPRWALALSAALALTAALALGACVSRPEGWSEATHGESAPAYDTVFPRDRVQELEIEIDPATLAAMRQDLSEILASSASPGGMGPGGMGPGGMAPDGGMRPPPMGADGGALPPPGDGGFGPPPMGGADGGGPLSLLAREPAYVPVTVRFNGREWPRVGMRFKGNSSLTQLGRSGNRKLPFRLDFDEFEDRYPEVSDQRFYGFKELTFSANFADDSQVREAFVLDALEQRGVPTARYTFARVAIRSGSTVEYWGLYTMIEDPSDDAMLDRVFRSHRGNTYKPDGATASWASFARADFEKKNNDREADWSDVEAAIRAVNDRATSGAAWRQSLEARFDVDGFLRWLAVNTVAANWDAYGTLAHNYYLYGDPAQSGRLRWIPWDHNLSMGASVGAMGRATSDPREIFLHTAVGESWPLIRRVLDDETYMTAYRAHVLATLEGPFAPATARARLEALHAVVAPHVAGERGEQPGSTTVSSREAFEQSITGTAGLSPWIERRVTLARSALAP